MKSTINNSKRTESMVDFGQHHHYHHHEEEDSNEENTVNDSQSGHHIHHHHHFHYHHHHHHRRHNNNNDSNDNDNEEHKPIVQPNPAQAPPRVNFQPGIRIYCKLDSNNFLSITDEKLVLAPSNADDKRQHWDMHRDSTRKDGMGQYAFALVNKATAQAIRHGYHSEGSCHARVELITYNPEAFDVKILWVHSLEKPEYDGYKKLCPYAHTVCNLNASGFRHGGHIACPLSEAIGPYQLWMFRID